MLDKPFLSPAFYEELASENPFGLTLHWREVEAWFDYIAWPAYKTYKYTRHSRAVRRWWARCSMKDLERARAAMGNVDLEQAQTEQNALVPNDRDPDTPYNDTLRSIFGGKGGET
jgi:hypothetical protein